MSKKKNPTCNVKFLNFWMPKNLIDVFFHYLDTIFCIHIIIDKIYVGSVKDHFLQSCITVTEYIFVL